MTPEHHETVSFSLVNKLLDELHRFDHDHERFSVEDLVSSYPQQLVSPSLIEELVSHHYLLLRRSDPHLQPQHYLARFPRHLPWQHVLAAGKAAAAPVSDDWFSAPTSAGLLGPGSVNLSGQSIPEFENGPLESLPFPLQQKLRRRMRLESHEADSVIFREGTVGDCLLVVTAGQVKITTQADGACLATVGQGQLLGEMSLIGISHRTASAVAEGPVLVLSLPAADFHQLCKEHLEFAQVVTDIVAERLGAAQQDVLFAKMLHGYRLARRLGRGGMSVVYDAVHAETGRRVALKMMSHKLVYDDRAREWFRSEADLIARFDHPNIPRLYERFDGFGTCFMVIEFVEGATLAELLQKRYELDERTILAIAGQLAIALDYAHRNGIVHRDVKPANCMLDCSGSVKLMDFGLSVPFQTQLDPSGVIVGTLGYMAPEQLTGAAPQPASDWFSLGCVLYELSTRQRLLKPRSFLSLAPVFEHWRVQTILDELPEMPRLKPLLGQLLQLEPAARLAAVSELLTYAKAHEVNVSGVMSVEA